MSDASSGNRNAYRIQDNSLGLAGFIVSVFGILTCGILSPIGLLLSIFGAFKQPRGLAILGIVNGVIGSIGLLIVGSFFAVGLLGLSAVADAVDKARRVQQASNLVCDFAEENERLPTVAEAQTLFAEIDPSGDRLRYEPGEAGNFTVVEAGSDNEFDTFDDLDLEENAFAPKENDEDSPIFDEAEDSGELMDKPAE
ncbi:DUF4190 domain-containing protein [Blastopirellula sp. JC732]|uniref:DUF4190 domain-containing protein n=1 Tax=Blastopirellula sediminis TaxID=2894196 RepID=A0A9X1MSM2_9BACT|nr:DUF4190 domain-containing protein [Blastopirellula sediminis]MCC9605358.1 DUF4190 domain-containing protein [Blastopirellula sediminis]MCC9631342.1 DUF4190 domain-containing protein [Blastopirellula sediminis]